MAHMHHCKAVFKYFLVYLLTETDALKEKNMSSVGGNLPNLFAFCLLVLGFLPSYCALLSNNNNSQRVSYLL